MSHIENDHRCPILRCPTMVAHDRLMCAKHWRMVPQPLQRAVLRTWRARLRRRGDQVALRAHLQACEDAEAAVEDRTPRELFAGVER